MQFDHLGDKAFNISMEGRHFSFARLSREVAKCEVVCANCHAEIYREWTASAHSRSATGRRFRNLYDGTDWNGDAGVGWGLQYGALAALTSKRPLTRAVAR
jgi:hypothetical protein